MSKKPEPTPAQSKNIILSYVFNSLVLVPWSAVKDYQDDPVELEEKVRLWSEVNIPGYRFKENQEVCEIGNPTLKMTIRQILRQKDKSGEKNEKGEAKQRLIGFECYWWASVEDAFAQISLMNLRGNRRVATIEE